MLNYLYLHIVSLMGFKILKASINCTCLIILVNINCIDKSRCVLCMCCSVPILYRMNVLTVGYINIIFMNDFKTNCLNLITYL